MKNTKINAISFENNTLNITLPSKLNNIKIVNANLLIGIGQVSNPENYFNVNYMPIANNINLEGWNDVEVLKNVYDNQIITINISDELQDAIFKKAETLQLKFVGNATLALKNDFESELKIDYISLSEYQENVSSHSINLNKAGEISVNIATGKLSLDVPLVTTNNGAMPLTLNAHYNTFDYNFSDPENLSGTTNNAILENGMPKNWGLNVNQFLIENSGFDELNFTYIDNIGQEQTIIEKYYYIENEKKVFVPKQDITIDIDGNLKLKNSNIKLFKQLDSLSGLKLVSSIKDISGHKLIDYEPEELISVKNEISNLEKNVENYTTNILANKKQLILLALTKNVLLKQHENQFNSLSNNSWLNNLNATLNVATAESIDINNYSYAKDFLSYHNGLIPDNYIKKIYRFTLHYKDNALQDEVSDIPKTGKPNETDFLHSGDINCLRQIFNSGLLQSMGADFTGKNKGSFLLQQQNIELNNELYKVQINSSVLSSILNETLTNNLGKEIIKTDEIDSFIKECGNNFTLSKKDLVTIESQIESTIKVINTYTKELEEINLLLLKAKKKKENLEMQVPVHYLYNSDNVVYGFGKTEQKNVFRLILITDAYENTLFIAYKSLSDNRIDYISNSKEKILTFEYSDNNMLKSITDTRSRKVGFEYSNNLNLTKIINIDSSVNYYYYSSNLISEVLNSNGFGAKIDYNNEQVASIFEISVLDKVENGKIYYKTNFNFDNAADFSDFVIKDKKVFFNYNNYKSTTITNSNNKSVTYVFNSLGQTTTIYENNFSENELDVTPNVTNFTYKTNKIAQKTSVLPYSTNFLSDVCFNNSTIVYKPALFLGTTYLGDDAIPYTYPVCEKFHTISAETELKIDSITVSQQMILKINDEEKNCLHKCFVLCGWAKANSAFILTDENPEDYANYIKNRKFEISAVITYSETNSDVETFSQCFDWRNIDWQYCALAITLKNKPIENIVCSINYNNNTGEIKYTDLELKKGTFDTAIYDEFNRVKTQESSHSEWLTTLYYENDEAVNPIKQIITSKLNPELNFVSTFKYTKQGSCVRSVDYNGIVQENLFNNNGKAIKTISYHLTEPSGKFYEETILDEDGNVSKSVNELGNEVSTISYDNGMVSCQTDNSGVKTAYGYSLDNTLLETTSTVAGIENTNTFGYTLDFLTSLKHNNFEIGYNYDNNGRISKILIAGKEYLSKTYGNNEETTILASGEVYRQTFNDFGKVLDIFYKSSSTSNEVHVLQNIYDSYGNLVNSKGLNNEIHEISINEFGNATKEKSIQHSVEVVAENSYDHNHEKITNSLFKIGNIELPYKFAYSNDVDAKLNSVTLPNSTLQTLQYDKLQRVSTISTGNLSKNFSYLKNGDHATKLISNLQFAVNGVSSDCIKYCYDEKGNITEVRNNNKLVARYFYDGLSRLIREDNPEFNTTTTFSYDSGGNINIKTVYPFTLATNLDCEIGTPFVYSYPTSGWKDQLVSYNGEKFEYDNLGNPTTYRNKTLKWSYGRQLDNFSDIAEYSYNASGIRTSKTVNGIITKFFLNGSKIFSEQNVNKNIYFHYGADGLTGFTLNGIDYLYKKNIQNDIIGIFDKNQTEIVKYLYDAWGNAKIFILHNNRYVDISNTDSYNEVDSANKFVAESNPFRYRSYYYDSETNLYYLNSRYYDPELGRFINADDISNISSNELNGLNLYAYCCNNPVNRWDTTGESWQSFWKGMGNWLKENWLKITIGAVLIIGGSLAAFFTAGMGTAGLLSACSALLSSAKAVGISMAFSSGVGAILGGITGGWNGALQGFTNGLADGFLWGGIFAGSAQILGAASKLFANRSVNFTDNFNWLFGNRNTQSTTLIRVNKSGKQLFRIDASIKELWHIHYGKTSALMRIHRTGISLLSYLGITNVLKFLFSNF